MRCQVCATHPELRLLLSLTLFFIFQDINNTDALLYHVETYTYSKGCIISVEKPCEPWEAFQWGVGSSYFNLREICLDAPPIQCPQQQLGSPRNSPSVYLMLTDPDHRGTHLLTNLSWSLPLPFLHPWNHMLRLSVCPALTPAPQFPPCQSQGELVLKLRQAETSKHHTPSLWTVLYISEGRGMFDYQECWFQPGREPLWMTLQATDGGKREERGQQRDMPCVRLWTD